MEHNCRPIYLHFLDRELSRAAEFKPTPMQIEKILKCVLLSTTSSLYCGLSLLWESDGISQSNAVFFKKLVSAKILNVISHHSTSSEFLDSRQAIYAHDSARYPMYFGGLSKTLIKIKPTIYKDTSTTNQLAMKMSSWSMDDSCISEIGNKNNIDLIKETRKIVIDKLNNRDNRALTYTLFEESLSTYPISAQQDIRRLISKFYVEHYQNYKDCDIITGISYLHIFDRLSIKFPYYDIQILEFILNQIGFKDLIKTASRESKQFWNEMEIWYGSNGHVNLSNHIALIIDVLLKSYINSHININFQNHQNVRDTIKQQIMRFATGANISDVPRSNHYFEIANMNLCQIIGQIRNDKNTAGIMETIMHERGSLSCDILLVTATDIEHKTVSHILQEHYQRDFKYINSNTNVYVDLGYIGKNRVFLAPTQMGSGGPGGSQQTVNDAIDQFNPDSIILVGIAFGIDKVKQKIGEILISEKLFCYEMSKVVAEPNGAIISRNDCPRATPRLVKGFALAKISWNVSNVTSGVILSGDKLIDNLNYRDSILAHAPEAIGGEMEGNGLYSAAHSNKKDWIVVKAICDWADGSKKYNKNQRQKVAAENSIKYVFHVIKSGAIDTKKIGMII